jgi:hypothetical protein
MTDRIQPIGWLILIHQLPAKPAYLRVKVWRRLQALGAVSLKGAVAALPASEQAREDLQWVTREIAEGGGEAMICEARLLDGMTDFEIQGLFSAARSADYRALAADVGFLGETLPAEPVTHWNGGPDAQAQIVRFRKRLAQIAVIDFFGADGRQAVERSLAALEARLTPAPVEPDASMSISPASLIGQTWVTRMGVGIDRIACAWLIRRFIDAEARFRFVSNKTYVPEPDEVRFDMTEAEFTHEGDWCSFETILHRLNMTDPALKAIGEIVHDIDLKDGRFGHDEAAGIGRLIEGVARAHSDDEKRIARGSAVLDDLYLAFTAKP